MTTLDRALLRLANDAPFYSKAVGRMRRYYDDSVGTACVYFDTDGMPVLKVAGPWFDSLYPHHREGVLIHEFLHLLWNHLPRRRNREAMRWNYATDCAINAQIRSCYPEHLPDGALYPERFGLMPWADADEYYDKLPASPQGGATLDDHRVWNDNVLARHQLDRIIAEAYREACAERGKAAVDRQLGRSPGAGSDNVLERIQRAITGPRVPWSQLMRRYVQAALNGAARRSWRRVNRRRPWEAAGKVRDQSVRGVIAIDTSGSSGAAEFSAFSYQVSRLAAECGGTWTVIEADSQVQREYQLRGALRSDVQGRGGTLFGPTLERAAQLRPDVLVYFSDGENGDGRLPEQAFPVLWVLTQQTDWHSQHGQTIVLEKGEGDAT